MAERYRGALQALKISAWRDYFDMNQFTSRMGKAGTSIGRALLLRAGRLMACSYGPVATRLPHRHVHAGHGDMLPGLPDLAEHQFIRQHVRRRTQLLRYLVPPLNSWHVMDQRLCSAAISSAEGCARAYPPRAPDGACA
jgi:hypothetical protein